MQRSHRIRSVAVALVILPMIACGPVLRAAGFPPEATRKSPPEGIETRALKGGDEFPSLELAGTTGTIAFPLTVRHIVVFYRGSW